MAALVVYDSLYGNTERIASAVAAVLGAETVRVGEVSPEDLARCDLLVIGSPTHGGRASAATKALLARLPPGALEGKRVAAFDTRSILESNAVVRLLVRMLGYAAPRLASELHRLGGQIEVDPMGFLVHGKEGPLLDGEEARAESWARSLRPGARLAG